MTETENEKETSDTGIVCIRTERHAVYIGHFFGASASFDDKDHNKVCAKF